MSEYEFTIVYWTWIRNSNYERKKTQYTKWKGIRNQAKIRKNEMKRIRFQFSFLASSLFFFFLFVFLFFGSPRMKMTYTHVPKWIDSSPLNCFFFSLLFHFVIPLSVLMMPWCVLTLFTFLTFHSHLANVEEHTWTDISNTYLPFKWEMMASGCCIRNVTLLLGNQQLIQFFRFYYYYWHFFPAFNHLHQAIKIASSRAKMKIDWGVGFRSIIYLLLVLFISDRSWQMISF